MTTKKYELLPTDKTSNFGKPLFRIRALRDIVNYKFSDPIKTGTLGGYVVSESNLSQEGECWIADEACVATEDACVRGDARIAGKAELSGRAIVEGNAYVGENADVSGTTYIGEEAQVRENAFISGDGIMEVFGKAVISGNAHLIGDGILKISGYIHYADRDIVAAQEGDRIELSSRGSYSQITRVRGPAPVRFPSA